MYFIRHRETAILRMCACKDGKGSADYDRELLCPMLKQTFSKTLKCESPEVNKSHKKLFSSNLSTEILHSSTRRTFFPFRSTAILYTPPEPITTSTLHPPKCLRYSPQFPHRRMRGPRPLPQCSLLHRPKLRHHIPRPYTNDLLTPTTPKYIPHKHHARILSTRSRHPFNRESPRSRRAQPGRLPRRNRRRHQAITHTLLLPLTAPPNLTNLHLLLQASHRSPPDATTKHQQRRTCNGRPFMLSTRPPHTPQANIRRQIPALRPLIHVLQRFKDSTLHNHTRRSRSAGIRSRELGLITTNRTRSSHRHPFSLNRRDTAALTLSPTQLKLIRTSEDRSSLSGVVLGLYGGRGE